MNCLNCGAPLELAEGRAVLSCKYCDSTRRLQTDLEDGDQVISLDRPSDLDCPRCQHQLVKAALDGHAVDHCPECRGILLETALFADISRNRRAKYRGPEMPAELIDPAELQEFIDCPQCNTTMDVHPNYGPGQSVIDSCSGCNLVWLDCLEMTRIERTPGRR